jgi:hypothetical protein
VEVNRGLGRRCGELVEREFRQGRDEDELPWTMAWVRHHDKYEDSAKSESRCGAEHRKDDAA